MVRGRFVHNPPELGTQVGYALTGPLPREKDAFFYLFLQSSAAVFWFEW